MSAEFLESLEARVAQAIDRLAALAEENEELRQLKAEASATEIKREECTAKISELIALEKNLKFRISEHEKKINLVEGKN